MPDQPKIDEPKVKVSFREFQGMTSNVNPHRVEPGAMLEQTNCRTARAGELVVRSGYREVTFDS